MTVRPFLFAGLLALTGAPALAEITIHDAYLRTATPTARTGAAFMVIHNDGPQADRLIGVGGDFAARVELHTHRDSGNGVMQMIHVEEGFEIPAGGTHALRRGGDHVMLMGLSRPLPDGETVTLTLIFETTGEVVIEVPVDRTRVDDAPATDHGSGS